MSKKEQTQENLSCRLGSVGGQAIVEGVMMKSKKHTAIAVRRMDNKRITVSRKGNTSISDKCKILKWPIIRGVVNFAESLIVSFSTITEGTDMLGIDEFEEESKFDKWLNKHFGKWIMPVISVISVILGLALALGLFIYLPTLLGGLALKLFGEPVDVEGELKYIISNPALTRLIRSVIEGVLRIIIFIGYIWLTALIPDMKRVYMYHGAEHKSIFCYEKGIELTVENVKKEKRFHPRCGTSFMFAMMFLSIFIGFFITIDISWLRSLVKIALLPLTVGIGYEFIRYAGRHDNALIRALAAPGLWMQRLTTKEPTDDIIEVGITSLKCALPDEFPGFYEEMLEQQKAFEAEEEAKKAAESVEADNANEGNEGENTEENIEA
ncbi:MAG: DUF1385 domain-containing protein [Clostridia bacterium]|nr:DUF1385 domain-containing protein [Clostridia bacterium]